MGQRLRLQAFPVTPRRELQLRVCLVRCARTTIEVFADCVAVGRIVLDQRSRDLRATPFPLIGNHSHQSSRERMGRVNENGQREMFHSFGRKAVRLAPDGQSYMGIGIAPDF